MVFPAVQTKAGESLANSVEAGSQKTEAIPSVAEIEKDISTNTDLSTQRLIKTLEALESRDLYYECALVKVTEEERLKGPPKYDAFKKIVHELAVRGGESVWQAFRKVLIEEKLQASEKSLVREIFLKEAGEDAPFTLSAHDRTQTRQYLLRFNPKRNTVVTVHKGDMLVQIARRAYPHLSQWSAVDILAFTNDLKNWDSLQLNQTLRIYEYDIVKDAQAPGMEPVGAATH